MRVLFVDDEPRILTGIENALIFADDHWDASFASSGEEALAMIEANRYDVLVTDMKMPGLTGADVLERAIATHPEIVRLVLSGEVDPELAERAMPLTHEFVSKPCDPDDLFAIIERVYVASRSLEDSTVRDVLGSLDRLPSQPNLHLKIQDALGNGAGADVVSRLIETDLAIASSIIKTANSAFYGFRTPAENVRDAVVRLGTQTVSGIVLNAEVGRWASPEMQSLVAHLNAHSARVADLLRKLVGNQVAQAALVGLLHDVGLLVLITQFSDEFASLRESGWNEHDPDQAAERAAFGATHAEIGAYMLDMWHADPIVVEATRHHHDGRSAQLGDKSQLLVDAIAATTVAEHPELEPPSGLDPELIKRASSLMVELDQHGEGS